jgi:hypothetical protein
VINLKSAKVGSITGTAKYRKAENVLIAISAAENKKADEKE